MTAIQKAREANTAGEWRYSINYGPEGEANYAFVYDEGGHLVSNLKIHHAIAIVEQMNRCSALAALDAETEVKVNLTRPIIGIENRTAQEVFDIMCDRIRSALVPPESRS